MTERRAADEFLMGALSGSADLVSLATNGIHPNEAPPGTLPPYVVFSVATATDDYANDRIRVDTEIRYIVRAVVEGNSPTADPMEEAIDLALSGPNGGDLAVNQNGYRIWCRRQGPLATFSTSRPGATFRYAGGWYRVNVRKLID